MKEPSRKSKKKEYISSHLLEKLPERMKAAREHVGRTKTDMARWLKCSTSMIGMYESGERTPSLEVLVEFCSVTRINPAWLLGFHTHKYMAPRETMIDRKINIKRIIDHISDEREIEAIWYLLDFSRNLSGPVYQGLTSTDTGAYIADPKELELEENEEIALYHEYGLERANYEKERLIKRLNDIENHINLIKEIQEDERQQRQEN